MAQLVKGGRKPAEAFGQRLVRNIAKAPTLAYEAATTGFGLGNLSNLVADRIKARLEQVGAPQSVARGLTNLSPLRLLNTTQQAREQAGQVLPRYMTETRKGDAPWEFLVRDLPIAAASGGLSSVGRAAGTLATGAGMYAGSALGQNVGQALGKQVGEPELGAALGSLAGGAGGALASRAVQNLPSRVIPPKLKQKIENQRTQGLQALEQQSQARQTRMQELEQTRGAEYAQAEQAGKNVFVEGAPQLKQALQKIGKQLDAGIERADLKRIGDISGQVERFANQKRININDAVALKQNLNTALYDRNLPPTVRKAYTEYRNALSDFISESGQKNPEFGRPFSSAEAKTIELKNLQKTRPAFEKAQKIAARTIEQAYKNTLKDPETVKILDANLTSTVKDKIPYLFATGAKLTGSSYPIAAGIGAVAGFANRELSILRTAYKNHPDIFADYAQLLEAAARRDLPRLTNVAAQIESKLEKSDNKPRLIKGGRKKPNKRI